MTPSSSVKNVEPKIALASWSFHSLFEDERREPRFDEIEFMEMALSEPLRLKGVEFLYSHLDRSRPDSSLHPRPEPLAEVREKARELNVEIVCVAVHNDFVRFGPKDDIKYVLTAIENAEALGATRLRINTGLSTYVAAAVGTFLENAREVAQKSREAGITLVLENQGGITLDPYNILDIMLRARAEWGADEAKHLRFCLDFGNFTANDCVLAVKLLARQCNDGQINSPGDIKAQYLQSALRRLAAALGKQPSEVCDLQGCDLTQTGMNENYIAHVHAKCYSRDPGRPPFEGLERDYDHILYQLFLAGFDGWFSIEYEGMDDIASASEMRQSGLHGARPPAPVESIVNMRNLIIDEYRKFNRDRGIRR